MVEEPARVTAASDAVPKLPTIMLSTATVSMSDTYDAATGRERVIVSRKSLIRDMVET